MKIINFFLIIITISLISCQKDEKPPINPCANGKLDAGEVEIDCGGTCKDCTKYSYLYVNYEDSLYGVSSKSLNFDGTNYILTASFDTIEFSLNFGSNGNVGLYDISASNSSCMGGQLPYTFISGIIGISENDTNLKEMSGNFQANFKRGLDTIKLTNGQFEYLKY